MKLSKCFFLLPQVSEYCMANYCRFLAPNLKSSKGPTNVTVKLRVQETALDCGSLQYLDDPRFTGYRAESEVDTELEVKIQVCLSHSRCGGRGDVLPSTRKVCYVCEFPHVPRVLHLVLHRKKMITSTYPRKTLKLLSSMETINH